MTFDFSKRVQDNLEKLSERVALQYISQDTNESFTYGRIGQEVAQISLFLKSQSIGPGSTVGILMENHPRWAIAFLATQSTGARIAPFDILHDSKTLAELIQHAECRFLISSRKFLPEIQKIQELLPAPLPALITGPPVEGHFHWETLLTQGKETSPVAWVDGDLDEGFVLLYTSGTTGNPKGVVLSRRNLNGNVEELLKIVRVTPDDHVLSVLPLYHVMALMVNFIVSLVHRRPGNLFGLPGHSAHSQDLPR